MVEQGSELCRINGKWYALAADPDSGGRSWRVTHRPSTPQDMESFREEVPFGVWGMGSSIRAVDNQCSYSLGTNLESWGELGPGYAQNDLGNAYDTQVTALAVASSATAATASGTAPTGASLTGIGDTAWTNPTNITANDATRATSAPVTTSNYLHAHSFAGITSIPSDAVIGGFTVSVDGQANGAGTVDSAHVRMVKGGVVQTTVTRSSQLANGADSTTTYGSTTDLFGVEWAVGDVTATGATGFGVAFYWDSGGGATTASIDTITVSIPYRTAGGKKFLYVGYANKLEKWDLSDFSKDDTKTFASSAVISDVVFLKDSPAPGNAQGLVAFNATAQIEQIDLIGATTDTYGTKAATAAYAGVFALAQSESNTAPQVWKSTPGPGGGAFSRVQSGTITESSSLDFTSSANWNPSTPYQVGQFSQPITDLSDYQRALVIGKPEGVFQFDENFNAYPILDTRGYIHSENGTNLLPFGRSLLVPTSQDLLTYPAANRAAVGLSSLVSNLSPIQGRPTATTSWGQYVFCSFYDGTDSYICKARRVDHENVPQEYLWYGIKKVVSYKVTKMLVTSNYAESVTYLFYSQASATSTKHDVGYVVLGPVSQLRYNGAVEWYGSLMGDPARKTRIEAIRTYAVGSLNGSTYFEIWVLWDEAAAQSLATVVAAGQREIVLTPGTNDNGCQYQLKVTGVNAISTANPRLRGTTIGDIGGGGLIVEGQRQVLGQVDEFAAVLDLSPGKRDKNGSEIKENPKEQWANLITALAPGTIVDIVYRPHHGTEATHKVIVLGLESTEGKSVSGDLPARQVVARFRALQGST